MKTKIVTILAAVMLVSSSVVNAAIVVLDFESLSTPGTGYTSLGPSYTEAGFNLQAVPIGGLYYYHSDDENFAGSTALFSMAPGAGLFDTMLTQADGLIFDLVSIDLTEWRPDVSGGRVALIGTKSDNSTVTTYLTLDGVFGFERYTVEGFTGLTALRLALESTTFQYDNIVLDVIPEPATILLLGLGVLLLRRRQ